LVIVKFLLKLENKFGVGIAGAEIYVPSESAGLQDAMNAALILEEVQGSKMEKIMEFPGFCNVISGVLNTNR
jgi:hypothetical protein